MGTDYPATPGSVGASTPMTGRSYRSTGRPTIVEMYREKRQQLLDTSSSLDRYDTSNNSSAEADTVAAAAAAAANAGTGSGAAVGVGELRRPQDRAAAAAARLATDMRAARPSTIAAAAALMRDISPAVAQLSPEALHAAEWPSERAAAMHEGVELSARLEELEARQLSHAVGDAAWDQECARIYTLLEATRYEVDKLESTRDASAARFAAHGVPFDFGMYERVRRAGLQLGAAYMGLILQEVLRDAPTRQAMQLGGMSPRSRENADRLALQMLTDALKVAYRCHTFARTWDDDSRARYAQLRRAALQYAKRCVHV